MSASGRSSIGLGIVPGEEVIENVTWVGEEISRQGWPFFWKERCYRLVHAQGLFPRLEPNFNLFRTIIEASIQSCIPAADSALHNSTQPIRLARLV